MADQRVTMSDIARHLDITLSAVSNWRRRHPSFPSGEEIDGQEKFLVAEVANWLDGRKISSNGLRPDELPGTTYGTRFRNSMRSGRGSNVAVPKAVWRELSKLRGAEDVAEFADLVLGLLYLATSENRDWNDIVRAVDAQRMRIVAEAFWDHHPHCGASASDATRSSGTCATEAAFRKSFS